MIIEIDTFMQMLFLLAPAGIANTAPVWGAKIPLLKNWNTPLDLGIKYKGKRLLGDNKTYRGILMGFASGAATGTVLAYISSQSTYVSGRIDIFSSEINLILLGGLLGLFALLGDAAKSFFKRKAGIKPGRAWPILDQIDYILGAYIVIGLIFNLTPTHYIVGLITYALIHPLISYAAYLLKLKKDRF